ncbi:MAG TPA: GIY-YIG nuclease family protein [Candidatus Kapabacteria bacterium]|nr:GIY-YIG nuclease family protein [Candidatus Kapabacteria bacterium]
MKFQISPHRKITDEELLDDLRKITEKLGDDLTGSEYDAQGKFNSTTLARRFGGWNEALLAVGVEPKKLVDITDEILFKNLEEVWLKLGRQPKRKEMKQPLSRFSERPYYRFGTWKMALERFVEYTNSRTSDNQSISEGQPQSLATAGHVYLIQSGKYFKIGKTNDLGRRTKEIAIELPEASIVIHTIQTDDPYGIEAYWHRRFKDRRKNGEWFELSEADVQAFCSKSAM